MGKTFIHSFLYTADQITFYEKNSKNIFKGLISKKKRKELVKKIKNFTHDRVSKELLIEFINIYNGSYDIIKLDYVNTCINDDTKVFSMKITTKKGANIQVSTINNMSDNINITLNKNNDGLTKVISCHEEIKTDGENKDIIDNINELVMSIIVDYLRLYILKE